MNKETKSNLTIAAIAVGVMALLFIGIKLFKGSDSGSHSHGNGAVHSH